MRCDECVTLREEYESARDALRAAAGMLTEDYTLDFLEHVEQLRLRFARARDALERHLPAHHYAPSQ